VRSGPYPVTGPNRPGDQVTDSASALAIWVLVADRTPGAAHQLSTVQTRASGAGELSPASSPGREPTDRSHRTCSVSPKRASNKPTAAARPAGSRRWLARWAVPGVLDP
jgi:hypothetical protein